MGFVEGTRLRLVRAAPFGDPLEVEVDGCHLSLRRTEASLVLVGRA
jgi:Fe2+ transport system protein FeoA